MFAPVRTVAPAILPVSLEEAKAHLRVDSNDDDLITALIGAAVAHLDGWTGILGRCLVEQTWRQDYAHFGPCLPLPLGPVLGIVEVGYKDAQGNDHVVDPLCYELKTDAGGRSSVAFKPGFAVSGPVSSTYKAGYRTTPAQAEPATPAGSTVPDDLKLAILLMVGHWYENREAVAGVAMAELPLGAHALITPYRRIGL